MNDDGLVGAAEVASYLGVPRQTLYAWRVRGKGPDAARVGRYLKYSWDDVHAWLAEQKKNSSKA